uniref:Dolichyl-diphosphooligosaccharide--protein glycosyltransferase subunit KCP2 n=1 Tax=Panagrolaimus davidi TaxID=227884 RepID=A0A914QP90_9BILA
MANHSFSGVVFALALLTFTAGQTFKTYLAGSLQSTLVAGILGSFVFLFMLTAMSNFKMSSADSHVKSGLTEVLIALLIGIVASASIHRVSFTICLLASGVLLYLDTFVSHERYNISTLNKYRVIQEKVPTLKGRHLRCAYVCGKIDKTIVVFRAGGSLDKRGFGKGRKNWP